MLGYVTLGLVSSNFTLKLANRQSRQRVDGVKFSTLIPLYCDNIIPFFVDIRPFWSARQYSDKSFFVYFNTLKN
jgi:hypothetical protein